MGLGAESLTLQIVSLHKKTNDVQTNRERDNNASSKAYKQHIQSSKMIQCSKNEVL